MATLTADQITFIRMMSGDDCLDYDVSDTLLQKLFADRAGDDECKTIVYVLRIREAKAAVLTNESSEGKQKSLSQKRDHLHALREEWEERCGMYGGALDMGVFDLNLDTDCDDVSWADAVCL